MNTLAYELDVAVEQETELEQIDSLLKRTLESTAVNLVQNEGAHIPFEEYGAEKVTRPVVLVLCPAV